MASESDALVLFWEVGKEHGYMSQWYKSDFVVDGTTYCCAEQWMMAEKARLFGDKEACSAILGTKNARKMKSLGREIRGFTEAAWDAVKYDVVKRGTMAKFEQNAELRGLLLSTGEAYIAEASPMDTVWGIGTTSADRSEWRGENLLGKALMEVRAALAK